MRGGTCRPESLGFKEAVPVMDLWESELHVFCPGDFGVADSSSPLAGGPRRNPLWNFTNTNQRRPGSGDAHIDAYLMEDNPSTVAVLEKGSLQSSRMFLAHIESTFVG